jgi:hypothetical protein
LNTHTHIFDFIYTVYIDCPYSVLTDEVALCDAERLRSVLSVRRNVDFWPSALGSKYEYRYKKLLDRNTYGSDHLCVRDCVFLCGLQSYLLSFTSVEVWVKRPQKWITCCVSVRTVKWRRNFNELCTESFSQL